LLALSNQWSAGIPACGSLTSLPVLFATQQVDDEHKLTRHRSLTVVGAALYHPHTSAGRNSQPNKSASIAKHRRLKFVIKLDIINRLADQTGIPKLKAEQAVDALFHSMKEALSRGDRIELRGFGVFIVKPRKRGVGRNPRTGEEVAIPSGKTIRFKPGKELQAHEDGEELATE
jgi:DNA-binding protein HU-beta